MFNDTGPHSAPDELHTYDYLGFRLYIPRYLIWIYILLHTVRTPFGYSLLHHTPHTTVITYVLPITGVIPCAGVLAGVMTLHCSVYHIALALRHDAPRPVNP